MRFSRSGPTEFPFIPRPPHGTKNWNFDLVSPEGQLGDTHPLFWGRRIHLCGYFTSLQHWGVKQCGYLRPDRQNFCLFAFTPSHGTENGFFHFQGLVGQFW